MQTRSHVPGSFRDPSGFLFYRDGLVYRQVNSVYGELYEQLIGSGLYQALVDALLLIPHEEVEIEPKGDSQVQRLLATCEDICPDYTQQAFEGAFGRQFAIQESVEMEDSERTLHLVGKGNN